jgi:hypothetical protein
MREFDHQGLLLARAQGELFVSSLEQAQCSSPIFIHRFLLSRQAQALDQGTYLASSEELQNFFLSIQSCHYGKVRYQKEELYWLGYLYRYGAYTYNLSSKALFRLLPASKLILLYQPYHTMDPALALARLLETTSYHSEEDINQRAKMLYRQIIVNPRDK